MKDAKKPALTSGLVAVKGAAAPVQDMPPRSPAAPVAVETKTENVPINFKMPPAFVREFKVYAASHDMKLSELLGKAFEAYRRDNP